MTTDILKRLKEFVFEDLDEPLDVATLAKMTNRSPFHFSRAFTRSVGVSRIVMSFICGCGGWSK